MKIYSFPNVKTAKIIKDINLTALENDRIGRLSPYLNMLAKDDSSVDETLRDFSIEALSLKDRGDFIEEAGLCYFLDDKIMAALYFGTDSNGVVLENAYINRENKTLGKKAFVYLFKRAYEILRDIEKTMIEASDDTVCVYHYMIFGDNIRPAFASEIMTGIQPLPFVEDPLLLDALLEEAINEDSRRE